MAPESVYVGLGANLGAARDTLTRALKQLGELPSTRVVEVSSFYATAPVDAQGPNYINAVAELSTELQPRELLQALQAIELQHGRERPYHHAPRTLDLDLLLYGERLIQEPGLDVPHPRLHRRAFVLQPLLEIAPGLQHPALGPLAAWRARITDQATLKLP